MWCVGVRRTMARIAPARPATSPKVQHIRGISEISCFLKHIWGGGGAQSVSQSARSHNSQFSMSSNSNEPSCNVASFVVNSGPYTGARPSVPVCGGLIRAQERRPERARGHSASPFFDEKQFSSVTHACRCSTSYMPRYSNAGSTP
jgi:hypothetical protein